MAVPQNSIKRCRNYSTNRTPFCAVHIKVKDKQRTIQLYNGSILNTPEDDLKEVTTLTNPIFLWKELNKAIHITKNVSEQKRLEKQAKLIRSGSISKIIDEFEKLNIFTSKAEMFNFFVKKQTKHKKILDNIRYFLGVVYYFKRHEHTLKKLQIKIRIRQKYNKHIESILKIQKWIRHRMWLKNIPVKPKVIVKHYLPQINKIIIVQKQVKKFIQIKINHSHNCPYSLERYTDIPEKYRVMYEYIEGNRKHWRYYHIKWLDSDWKAQTEDKQYVIESVTRQELPEEFVEKIARKMWNLSRKENDFSLDQDETKTEYPIENDWNKPFLRRSLYRFSLMMLDMCDILGFDVKNINVWRHQHFRLKYQIFYLKVMPVLKNIVIETDLYKLEEDIFYITRDIFRTEFIFPDTEISHILAGDAIYGILRLLIVSKRKNQEVHQIIKDIIKENFQTLLIL